MICSSFFLSFITGALVVTALLGSSTVFYNIVFCGFPFYLALRVVDGYGAEVRTCNRLAVLQKSSFNNHALAWKKLTILTNHPILSIVAFTVKKCFENAE